VKALYTILLICLAMLLSACGGSGPEKSAETWFQSMAIADGTTALKLTCSAYKADIQNMGMLMGGINMMTGGMASDAKVDTSSVAFETIAKSGDEATVRVSGTYIQGLMGAAFEHQVDANFIIVKEDGEWKWCGER
jgi:hypothetical protein